MMLHPAYFAHVFEPLRGQRVGLVTVDGNAGDALICEATLQLAKYYEVEMYHWYDQPKISYDLLAISGGGNMGDDSPWIRSGAPTRAAAVATGLPVWVLPQSIDGELSESDRYQRLFVRDRYSLARVPAAILAPDLALAHQPYFEIPPATQPLGLYLRGDLEGLWRDRHQGDPGLPQAYEVGTAGYPDLVKRYLLHAAQFEQIVTDKLHYAVAGLICGRHVTLLPNSYYKNRGMYEAWLQHLGCHWADDPKEWL